MSLQRRGSARTLATLSSERMQLELRQKLLFVESQLHPTTAPSTRPATEQHVSVVQLSSDSRPTDAMQPIQVAHCLPQMARQVSCPLSTSAVLQLP